ncbi:MAG: flagellar hook capping FlgD N-terminal domain-containing protein [Pseudomonadota bacterium]
MEATPPISTIASTPASTTSTPGETQGSAATLASDFETFLSLLTAQLENQDPLQPLESTEFVAQLAQFSSVEQQIATNEALSEMLSKLEGSETAELSQWLGREVEAQSALSFEGTPIELAANPIGRADSALLTISDALGLPLGQIPIDPSEDTIRWDGDLGNGQTAEPGLYRFQIERFSGGSALPSEIPRGFATVTEVRIEDGGARLVLDGQDEISIADVRVVRAGT